MNPRTRVTVFAALATFLGSLSLLPIYESLGWLPPVFLAVALVAATSFAAHRVRALGPAAPLFMLAVLTCYLVAIYAHGVAPLGFVPGPAALRALHDTLSSGFTDTTDLAAPVPVTAGLGLMTTGGVGLVAVVVETLATNLRRPAVAGLPLLAIFTVPAAILSKGVGWQPFVYAAAGYLALLLAEGRDRITRWGRPVRSTRATPVQRYRDGAGRPGPGWASSSPISRSRASVVTTQLTQAGRRVGAVAVGIAVLVPVFIPGLHSGWFGTHHTAGGAGLGDEAGATSISAVVSLRRDLNEPVPQSLFTYTTTGDPAYLRMLTLDNFNGVQWTQSSITSAEDIKVDKGIPAPPNVTVQPARTVQTEITITGLHEPYLPVPGQPSSVKVHGDWLYNPHTAVIYSKHSSTLHQKYTVDSAVVAPTATYLNAVVEDYNDAELITDLKVPGNVPAAIQVQADDVIAAAHAQTAYQKAVALQNWFQSQFTYDITVRSGSGESALMSFLADKRGYCEQFAATMALMARLEGIPARVDVGFTPGTRVGTTSTYLVTTADAHAWPELYFPGAGWVRFEPTPRADGQTTTPTYATGVLPAPSASSTPSSTATAKPTGPENLPTVRPDGENTQVHKSAPSFGTSVGRLPWEWFALIALLVLLVLAPPSIRWWIRRRRWTDADTAAAMAHAAWADLGDDVNDLGLEWRGEVDSPRRAAAAIVATRRLHYDPQAQQALQRLASAEETARYSRRPGTGAGDLRADATAIRRALLTSMPWVTRWRAKLVPRSSGRAVGSLWTSVTDQVKGRANSAGAVLRSRLRRPAD